MRPDNTHEAEDRHHNRPKTAKTEKRRTAHGLYQNHVPSGMCRTSFLYPTAYLAAGAAATIPSLSITFFVTSSLIVSLMNTPADCEAVLSMM